jgi:hypothetical protein
LGNKGKWLAVVFDVSKMECHALNQSPFIIVPRLLDFISIFSVVLEKVVKDDPIFF